MVLRNFTGKWLMMSCWCTVLRISETGDSCPPHCKKRSIWLLHWNLKTCLQHCSLSHLKQHAYSASQAWWGPPWPSLGGIHHGYKAYPKSLSRNKPGTYFSLDSLTLRLGYWFSDHLLSIYCGLGTFLHSVENSDKSDMTLPSKIWQSSRGDKT